MAATDLLQSKIQQTPTIYAYELVGVPSHNGLLKVGYTVRDAETRVAEQCKTAGLNYKIVLERPAMRKDGRSFDDHAVHKILRSSGFQNPEGEWFRCTTKDVERAIWAVMNGRNTITERIETFRMRKEQKEAVDKTAKYFSSFYLDSGNEGLTPHFLWNAKMRFGKTFTAYQLALRMRWTRILVLTFKPAVKTAWKEDLLTHKDFEGWQFCEKQENREFNRVNERKPFVCFASFQDVLGRNSVGGIKATNEWIQEVSWDCIILDEYHYGAWGKNAKNFYDKKDTEMLERAQEVGEIIEQDAESTDEVASRELFEEDLMPLQTGAYLYLSGTPFRAISSGEFIEEQIYNWTYSDEQEAKQAWKPLPTSPGEEHNPYAALPKMVMMTYRMPDSITEIASQGEYDEFDLNEFFRAEGETFIHEEYVQKWLDLIRGAYTENLVSELKQGNEKPPMPYSDVRLMGYLQHTFWFLYDVASCQAMARLLRSRRNVFFSDYKVIVAAGNEAGMGAEAVKPVYEAMGNPLCSKTITLSCSKLTTGVTVRPWTGILMLRNLKSHETYFQSAFRVQSPWTTKDERGSEVVLKPYCYVFDFAPNRALRQIVEYGSKLDIHESNPEKKVETFIKFLPVLAYDGSSMKEVSASEILDMAMSGTTATLLARRWESALLVNVDNVTLSRLMNNTEAMRALMNIEGFRSLNKDIETIINRSEHVKKLKKEKGDSLTAKQRKELTDEEKEYKSKRKEIQEKLIKFATRIPIFMYLTDFREYNLQDVISNLEPDLFRKVTGLTVREFDLLKSLNVFNGELMNDAVFKFKRYEDDSLTYTGINTHDGNTRIGGWDTTIDKKDFDQKPFNIVHFGSQETTQRGEVTSSITSHVEENHTNAWDSVKTGDHVEHKTFGNGIVMSIDDKVIIVKFDTQEKKFLFPQAFEKGYLEVSE